MKKALALILSALIAGSALAGCGGAPADKPKTDGGNSSSAETVTLKLGHVNGDKTNYHFGMVKFAEEVERLTEGKVKVEVYANSQLGGERDMFEGMQLGTIDMAAVASPVMGAFVPEMAVLDAPFMFKNSEHAHKVIDGNVGKKLEELLKAQGTTVMSWMESGFRNVFSSKPIPDLKSFSGLKIRTMENQIHVKTFEAIGAIATPMPYGEVFTGLQQGTIDAAENATDNVLSQKFYEVAPHVAKTGHFHTFIAVCISDKALAKVPAELQPALLEAGKIASEYQRGLLVEANQKAEKELTELGVTFYEVNREDFVNATKDIAGQFSDIMPKDMIDEIKKLEAEC